MSVEMERIGIKNITIVDIGRVLRDQRTKIGASQLDIARRLGYANFNFVSMIETGRSKIPVGRVEDFVEVYGISPEFTLVILRVMYPDVLKTVLRLVKKIPKIFKEFVKEQDEEIEDIFNHIRSSIYSRN